MPWILVGNVGFRGMPRPPGGAQLKSAFERWLVVVRNWKETGANADMFEARNPRLNRDWVEMPRASHCRTVRWERMAWRMLWWLKGLTISNLYKSLIPTVWHPIALYAACTPCAIAVCPRLNDLWCQVADSFGTWVPWVFKKVKFAMQYICQNLVLLPASHVYHISIHIIHVVPRSWIVSSPKTAASLLGPVTGVGFSKPTSPGTDHQPSHPTGCQALRESLEQEEQLGELLRARLWALEQDPPWRSCLKVVS